MVWWKNMDWLSMDDYSSILGKSSQKKKEATGCLIRIMSGHVWSLSVECVIKIHTVTVLETAGFGNGVLVATCGLSSNMDTESTRFPPSLGIPSDNLRLLWQPMANHHATSEPTWRMKLPVSSLFAIVYKAGPPVFSLLVYQFRKRTVRCPMPQSNVGLYTLKYTWHNN